jgi:phytoene/squalene synthetase
MFNSQKLIDQFSQHVQTVVSGGFDQSLKMLDKETRDKAKVLKAFLMLPNELVGSGKKLLSGEKVELEIGKALDEMMKSLEAQWDEQMTPEQKAEFKNKMNEMGKGKIAEMTDVIFDNFLVLAKDLKFEKSWLEAFFQSMRMRVFEKRFATTAELEKYLYGNAGVLGLMINRVVGGDEKGEQPAVKLAEGIQLTNILRDVAGDWRRGRLYIPAEDLRLFTLSEEDVGAVLEKRASRDINNKFLELMRFQIDRAKSAYYYAFDNAHLIPSRSRLPVIVGAMVFLETLEKIEKACNWSVKKYLKKNYKRGWFTIPKALWRAGGVVRRAGKNIQ